MTAEFTQVPKGSTLLLAKDGDCRAVLAKSRTQADRMTPLIAFTGAGGKRWVVEFGPADIANLYATLQKWFKADADQVSEWWETLSSNDSEE